MAVVGPRDAPLHHRLPLRRAAPGPRSTEFDRERAPQELAEALKTGWPEGRVRLGFEDAARERAPAQARCASCSPTASSWCPRAALVEAERALKEPEEIEAHPRRRGARRRHLRLGAASAASGRAHRARGGALARGRDAPPRRRATELPVDRGLGRARRAAARRAARRRDPGRHARDPRHRGAGWTATARTARARWPPATLDDDLAEVYDARPARPAGGARRRAARPRPAARSTPWRAT